MCVKWQVSKISEDNVHRDTACLWSVTKIAGVTMVLEILVAVSHFAGKLQYFRIATKKSEIWLRFYILSKIISIPFYN